MPSISGAPRDLPRLLDATRFAAVAHSGQFRKGADKQPYIVHPIAVATILMEVGRVSDMDVLTAAILHDVLEDTDTMPDVLTMRFGERVASLVGELTKPRGLSTAQSREAVLARAPSMSPGAAAVKLADMAANATDLRESPPAGWSAERIAGYRGWMLEMADAMPRVNDRLYRRLLREARAFGQQAQLNKEAQQ